MNGLQPQVLNYRVGGLARDYKDLGYFNGLRTNQVPRDIARQTLHLKYFENKCNSLV